MGEHDRDDRDDPDAPGWEERLLDRLGRAEAECVRLGAALAEVTAGRDAIRAERARLADRLSRVLDETGVVRHATDEDCVGCGCRGLSPLEAVAALRAERDRLAVEIAGHQKAAELPSGGMGRVSEINDVLKQRVRATEASVAILAPLLRELLVDYRQRPEVRVALTALLAAPADAPGPAEGGGR